MTEVQKQKILAALEKDDYRMGTLITQTILSDPFQMRTASGASASPALQP